MSKVSVKKSWHSEMVTIETNLLSGQRGQLTTLFFFCVLVAIFVICSIICSYFPLHDRETTVKGPGDRLSSKQQVWIDLLCSLKVDIELCIVQVSKDEDRFLEEREALN